MGSQKSKPAKRAATDVTSQPLEPGVLFLAEVTEAYTKQSDVECDLVLGEVVQVVDDSEGEWWAIARPDQSYWVPAACLRKIETKSDQASAAAATSGASASGASAGAAADGAAREKTLIVMHGYRASEPRSLSVSMGDRLVLLEEQGDWLRVRNATGQEGWVPADFVQEERTLPSTGPAAAAVHRPPPGRPARPVSGSARPPSYTGTAPSASALATEDLLMLKRALEEQIQALRARVAALEDTNARLESELGTVKRELQVSLDTLRVQLSTTEDAVPRLSRQMRTLQEEVHEVRARVDVLRAVSLPSAGASGAPVTDAGPLPPASSSLALSPRRPGPPSDPLPRTLSPTRSMASPGAAAAPARPAALGLESYASTPAGSALRRTPTLTPPARPPPLGVTASATALGPPSRLPSLPPPSAADGGLDALGPPRRRPPMVPGTRY